MNKLDFKKKIIEEFETMYYNSFRLQGLMPMIRPVRVQYDITKKEYRTIQKIIDKGWVNFKLQIEKTI